MLQQPAEKKMITLNEMIRALKDKGLFLTTHLLENFSLKVDNEDYVLF